MTISGSFLAILFWMLLVLMPSGSALATEASFSQSTADQSAIQPADIEVFVQEGCPHCIKAKEFLSRLQQEQPGLRIVIRDVRQEPAAMDRLKRIAGRHGAAIPRVPAFEVGGQLIIGYSEEAFTAQRIRDSLARTQRQSLSVSDAISSCMAVESLTCGADMAPPATRPETFYVQFLGNRVSLDQAGLPLFTLAMGLLDGFNPCSMWVLILMISLLVPINNRRRMFAIAGTFVVVQGMTYFVFMAAWLNFFLLIGLARASETIIAIFALLAGAINLKDFWRLGWGVTLSIPAAAKPGIYARMRNILLAENLAAAIFGAAVLAVLVQVVELVCTSGFPALFTRILTLEKLDVPAYYGYLLLYDLAYMLDDVIVLSIGIITLSQRRLQEKEGRWLKLISGLVMAGLGIYLLAAPH